MKVRHARRLSVLAALAAALAAAPGAAQSFADPPPALRLQPLPPELTPQAAASPSGGLRARSGRPVWLLPAAGLVAGAVLYPMVVDGGCEDRDCMLYIPEPVTGALIGLLGGIGLEVILMVVEGRTTPIHPLLYSTASFGGYDIGGPADSDTAGPR